MKTAMQELIEYLEKDYYINELTNFGKDKIKFLEKEKEQIVNAYCDGAKGGANGNKGQHENGWVSIQMRNKYYKQTYNN